MKLRPAVILPPPACLRAGMRALGWMLLAVPTLALAQPAPTTPLPAAPASATLPVLEVPSSRPLLHSPLIVGATSDSFPSSYLNEQGQPEGFAIDLIDALARVMNLKIKRVLLPGRELHERFRQGEYDFLQSYTESSSRTTYTDFSVPYLTLQGALFVRQRNNPIHSFSDLNGRVMAGVGTGSIAEDFLRSRGLNTRIHYVSSSSEALKLVNQGEADAYFASRLTVLSVIDREKLKNIVELPVPIDNFDLRYCCSVHKGDAVLLARLNEGLAVLHRTGEYDRIYRKWFGRYDNAPVFTREEVIEYVAIALALALLAVTWGLLRQRTLRHNITLQAGELAEKEGLLRALYDNIPMAICVIEAAPGGHRLLTLNRRAATLFGLTMDAATDRRLDELPLAPEWSAHLAEALRRWPGGGSLHREEHSLAASHRVVVLTLVPIAPGAGGLSRICVLTEDITERRRLDEEIAQTRKLRAVGELVGGIAHEFNNLLTPVMLKVSEIQYSRAGDTRLRQDMTMVAEAAQRAAELTRRLLTFGRQTEMRAEALQLDKAVNGAIALLRPTMDRRIAWENAVPAGLPPLYFNSTDLNQILVNLLLNARDTLDEKLRSAPAADWIPRIRVEASALGLEAAELPRRFASQTLLGWQRLTVQDNGMGILPAVRERIFEPFYTTKGVGRGTGLGLATVWHLTTEAGGRVDLESTPGVGSAFHLLLPVWPVPAAAAPAISAGSGSPVGRARILVVEDDELVARTVVAVLERASHEVDHFADGAKGWQHFSTNPAVYDLLILDVNLPGLEGIEFARRVRTAGHKTRILIISGRLTPTQMQAIGAIRVDSVLAKPFGMHDFLKTVRDCLSPGKDAVQTAETTRIPPAGP